MDIDYYNNICSKAKSNSETDISLNDRKEEFINNNMTLCEEDCNLIEYNETSQKAKCSCLIKIHMPLIDNIKFDKNKLYKRFTDFNNYTNLNTIKCYKIVFTFNNLIKNYSFFIGILLLIIIKN